jgi:hypothetical protein
MFKGGSQHVPKISSRIGPHLRVWHRAPNFAGSALAISLDLCNQDLVESAHLEIVLLSREHKRINKVPTCVPV